MDGRRMSLSLLVMVGAETTNPYPCDGFSCCEESNFGPGPLDLTDPSEEGGGGFDQVLEGSKVFIFHCLRYFTSFQWFRYQHLPSPAHNASNSSGPALVPFPWGRAGSVDFVQGRKDNQTLVITAAIGQDEGFYVFRVSNGTHSVSGAFELIVSCRDPGPSFLTKQQPEWPVALGSPVTLTCAVTKADCKGAFYMTNAYWLWRNFTSNNTSILTNSTLDSVSVVCDRKGFSGRTCNVLIQAVIQELYDGEFVCKMTVGENRNQTVQLVPLPIHVRTWLPYVVGVAVGIVLVGLVAVVVGVRCRHRVRFYCRSPSHTELVEKDVVILHGDDHQEVVSDVLMPRVRALGLDILEEVTMPCTLECEDQKAAVRKCGSVILTFSDHELDTQGQVESLVSVRRPCRSYP